MLPPAATGLMARYFGVSGGATARNYWVQVNYSSGRSVLSGPVAVTTPASLDNNNKVLITWNPVVDAISYDVLQTSTSTPPQGSQASGVPGAIGITANSAEDKTTGAYQTYVPKYGGLLAVAYARYDFALDGGVIGAIIPTLTEVIPAGALLIGGQLKFPVAVTSGGAGTLAVGTSAGSSATSISTALALASMGLNALANVACTFAAGVRMTAAGSIQVTVGAVNLTAGVCEIFVLYFLPSTI